MVDKDTVLELLKQVYDPELGVNVVDLGLIYELDVEGGRVRIRMTLTTPGCPLHEAIVGGVRRVLEWHPGIEDVDVRVVWEPRWTPERLTPAGREALGFF